MSFTERTELLLGTEAIQLLTSKTVAVFGLGGVGSFCVEALARSGIGRLIIVDNDVIAESNINRQMYALHSTIGKCKTDVCEQRIKDINPSMKVEKYNIFFDRNTANKLDFSQIDYVADAIDSIPSKLLLIEKCKEFNVPIISSMGTANKTEPTLLRVADIAETSVDPLARIIRSELKKRNIQNLKTIFSTEKPRKVSAENAGRKILGSCSFVPSVAGLVIAGEIIKNLTGVNNEKG